MFGGFARGGNVLMVPSLLTLEKTRGAEHTFRESSGAGIAFDSNLRQHLRGSFFGMGIVPCLISKLCGGESIASSLGIKRELAKALERLPDGHRLPTTRGYLGLRFHRRTPHGLVEVRED